MSVPLCLSACCDACSHTLPTDLQVVPPHHLSPGVSGNQEANGVHHPYINRLSRRRGAVGRARQPWPAAPLLSCRFRTPDPTADPWRAHAGTQTPLASASHSAGQQHTNEACKADEQDVVAQQERDHCGRRSTTLDRFGEELPHLARTTTKVCETETAPAPCQPLARATSRAAERSLKAAPTIHSALRSHGLCNCCIMLNNKRHVGRAAAEQTVGYKPMCLR